MSLAKKYLNIVESSESNSSLLIQPKMNRRVLIVDDEKSVAESLQSVLLSANQLSIDCSTMPTGMYIFKAGNSSKKIVLE